MSMRQGYRMPAEWERHQKTFLAWPVQDSMCHPEDYEQVCREYYIPLVQAIAEFEPVTLIVNPQDVEHVPSLLEAVETPFSYPVDLLAIEHDDAWFRDNGPTFVINDRSEIAGVNWEFNAWGGKYTPCVKDNAVAAKLLDFYGIPQFDAGFVLEGGSIHTDGQGTLLTTEQCLLNENRNPERSKEEITQLLKRHLNIEHIIWLEQGLYGDETDGHIDNIACFVAPGKILLQVCDDPDDANFAITQSAWMRLRSAVDACNRKIEVYEIQQPPARYFADKRLTLSYLNFYFVNDGIILPVFGGDAEATDALAVQMLSQLFPDRKIRTIDGMAIIKEGGNVHCTTQQMPVFHMTNFKAEFE